MYDHDLARTILEQILAALITVADRASTVHTVDDFTRSPAGKERLDSICMLFLATGEAVKNLDKVTEGKLLSQFPEVDWKGVMGFRDIIAHQYFDIDAEQVLFICKNRLHPLIETIREMLKH